MPIPFCSVSGCINSRRSVDSKSTKFFRFPHSMRHRSKWVEFTGRGPNWTPSSKSSICSRHFIDESPSEANPIPTVEPAKETNSRCRTQSKRTATRSAHVALQFCYSVDDSTPIGISTASGSAGDRRKKENVGRKEEKANESNQSTASTEETGVEKKNRPQKRSKTGPTSFSPPEHSDFDESTKKKGEKRGKSSEMAVQFADDLKIAYNDELRDFVENWRNRRGIEVQRTSNVEKERENAVSAITLVNLCDDEDNEGENWIGNDDANERDPSSSEAIRALQIVKRYLDNAKLGEVETFARLERKIMETS